MSFNSCVIATKIEKCFLTGIDYTFPYHFQASNFSWLVVWTPLKNISQLGLLFPIKGKIKHVPNHQPVSIFLFPPKIIPDDLGVDSQKTRPGPDPTTARPRGAKWAATICGVMFFCMVNSHENWGNGDLNDTPVCKNVPWVGDFAQKKVQSNYQGSVFKHHSLSPKKTTMDLELIRHGIYHDIRM